MPASVERLLKVGFSYREAAVLQTRDDTTTTYAARTTVRVATAAGATVLPVGSVANLAVGDSVIVARGTGVAETRTITAVTATTGSESVTVAALTFAHAAGEAVEEVVTTASPASLAAFIRAGFTARQAALLRKTPAATMKELLVQGHFSRPQAQLLLVP